MPFRGRPFLRAGIILFLAVAAVLAVLLATPYPSDLLRSEIVRRAGILAGGKIEIASLELGFFPPRLVARGVRYERDDPGGGAIRFACNEADLSVPYRAYLGRLDRIESLWLSRPEFSLKRGGPEGPAAEREAADGGGGTAALSFGSVRVEGGSVRLEDPAAGWEAELAEVELRGAGKETGFLEGRLDGSRFLFRRGDHSVSGRAVAVYRIQGKRFEVSEIRLDAGAGALQAAGDLDLDLSGPRPRFHLAGEASLEKPGAPRDWIGDLSGRLTLDLEGEKRPDGIHFAASLRAPDLAYGGRTAKDLSLEALYRPGDLRVSSLNASGVLGGSVSGEGSLRWEEGAIAKARLEAQASLSDGSMDEISRLLGLPPLPLTGRLNHFGEFQMEAFDPATLEARGSITVSGRLREGARQAVTGSGRYRIRGSSLEVEEALLESSAASARFRGKIALTRGGDVEGTLEAEAGELAFLAPFLAGLPAPARAPLEEVLRGSPGATADVKGLLVRDSGNLTLEGRAEARSLRLGGTRLGDLRAGFRVSSSRLDVTRATLAGGDAAMDVSGWIGLASAADTSGDSFAVKGHAAGMDLAWLGPWAGIPVPAEGSVAAEFDLSGRPEEIVGQVDWRVDRPVIASLPVESAEGRFSLVPGGLLLEEMRLSREDGRLEASGRIGFGGAPILVYVNGDGIELGWLREAGPLKMEAEGRVRFQGGISGSLEKPSAEIDLEIPRLRVKETDLGAVSARFHADRQGGDLRIFPEEKGIALAGKVVWEQGLPFEADLDLEDFEVAASSLGGDLSGVDAGAVLSGSLRAKGEFRDVSRLEVAGTLHRIALRLGSQKFVSESPSTFRWRRPRLEMTPLHLTGAGTDVVLSGHLEPEAGAYKFAAEGEVALAALAPLWPGITAGGTGAFRFSLVGSPAGTSTEGFASVSGGRLQGGGLPLPVSSLEGRLVLDPPSGFHLEGVSLVAGGGRITLEGNGTLEGARVATMDIALDGSDVVALAPKGFRGRYDLDLRLTQDASGRLLGGKIDLIRGVYDEDFRLERSLLSLGREEAASVEEEGPEGPGFLETVDLDLDLEASRGLWIINDFATLEGAADFHVGGTAARPRITGRLSALEGGTIRFRQVRYRVRRGDIDLIDVDRFNPYLDLLAETKVSDYQVTLRIDGSLDNFSYELTSSPPLTQSEIVALLVSGRTPNTALEAGRTAQDVAAGYLTGGLASGLGGALQGVTGLDQFSIDPVYLTSQGDPASRITMGKQITENLFAAYSTLLGSSSEEIYRLEYRISRDFNFSSVREADGSVGGDLRYILRLRTAPDRGPAAAEPRPVKIGEVRVEGEPGMPEKRLLRLLRVRPGHELDRARLADRTEKVLRKYHRKSRWQATIETREEPVEDDPEKVNLLLEAHAGPEVRIRLQGVPSRRERRREIEDLWSRSIFPEEIPEEARARLERNLREDGYSRATVSLRMEVDTPSLRDVVLAADPGVRTRVAGIEISGNDSVATSRLESLLATRARRRGFLRPEQVNADAGRIRAHYLSLGYMQVKVPPPEIGYSENGELATVHFRVAEGDPTRVTDVRIEGNSAISSQDLLEGFPIRPDDPYTRERARAGAEAIRRAYDRAGYSTAKVGYELRGEEGPALVYRVEEGARRLVGKIEIQGNRLTRKEVVERELGFKEGKPLSSQEILESQKALYRLGIFSAVEIREIEGEDPARPTVRVQVAEASNLTQSLGIGYATDEGLRGLYEVTNSNLLGRARTVGLQLRGSDLNSRVQFLLRDPFLFNRRLDSLLSAFRERSERDSFTLTETGTTLQVSNKHGEEDRTIYRYILKSDKVTDLNISPDEAGVESLRLSGFSGGYIHDSRDNFYNPRRGAFASVNLTGYGQAIGSQAVFLKFFAQGSLFRKGPGDSVWAQSVRLGLADPFGISDSLPLSERFFAGGDTTVRGFPFERLGPLDPVTNEPTGGESLFIVNEEFRFPIWRFLRGIVFFDAGNVTSRLSEFNPLDLRTVLGTGLRIDTPIGPIRFEYGWKLDREEGETPGELHITVGQAF